MSAEPSSPAIGLRHQESMTVEPRHTVPQVAPDWSGFTGMPAAFATAMMVGFIEHTCVEALRPHLAGTERTLGTHIDVSHIAATPVGMRVTASVELTAVEGKALTFRVTCSDDAGLIGEGTHKRFIVDGARFEQRLQAKAASV